MNNKDKKYISLFSSYRFILVNDWFLHYMIDEFSITVSTGQWVTSAYSLATGIMMPLVTWGTSNVDKSKTAHATALLTSLRTIASAIGQAVFVGIMTSVAAASISEYGENAMIHGLNISFLAMSVGALLLVIIAVFFVKKNRMFFIEVQVPQHLPILIFYKFIPLRTGLINKIPYHLRIGG